MISGELESRTHRKEHGVTLFLQYIAILFKFDLFFFI